MGAASKTAQVQTQAQTRGPTSPSTAGQGSSPSPSPAPAAGPGYQGLRQTMASGGAALRAAAAGGAGALQALQSGLGNRAFGEVVKGSVGLVKDAGTSSITHDLVKSLVLQHGLAQYLESIEKAIFGLLDAKLGGVDAPQRLAGGLAPYLKVLQRIKAIWGAIPEVIRKLIVYGIGRGLRHISTSYLGGVITEAHLNALFVGTDWSQKFWDMYSFLTDLAYYPASTLYKVFWGGLAGYGGVKQMTGSEADTPAAEILRRVAGGDAAPSAGQSSSEERKGPLVDADFKYLWLIIDRPELSRWQEPSPQSAADPVERGGLVTPFTFGLHVFGKTLESRDTQQVRLPWSGGFEIDLKNIVFDNVVDLPPVFSLEALQLDSVRVTDEGLKEFSASITGMSFADDIVQIPRVYGEWVKGSGLTLGGEMSVDILDQTIEGSAELQLDEKGGFKEASLTVGSPGPIDVIDEVLTFENPEFSGRVSEDGEIEIKVSTDLETDWQDLVNLKLENAHIDYHRGEEKGHAFWGGADFVRIGIGGDRLQLSAHNVLIRRGLLLAETAQLVYDYDPEKAEFERFRANTVSFGLNPSFLSGVGVEKLRIGGEVINLRIGSPKDQNGKLAQADDVQVQSGPHSQQVTPSQPEGRLGSLISVESVKPVVSAIEAEVFGLKASIDFKERKGSLGGEFSWEPEIPAPDFEVPIIPGVNVYGSLDLKAKLKAGIGAGLQILEVTDDACVLGYEAGAEAEGRFRAEAQAGLSLGSGLVASLGAGAFASGGGDVNGTFKLMGAFQYDRKNNRFKTVNDPARGLKVHYELRASLKADAGIVVQGRLLYFYKRDLFRYTFKDWTLGEYALEGDLSWKDIRQFSVQAFRRSAFRTRDGKPRPPTVEAEKIASLEDARKLLFQRDMPIPGSGPPRQALLDEIKHKYLAADVEVCRRLDLASLHLAELKYKQNKRIMSLWGNTIFMKRKIKKLDKKIQRLEQEVAQAKAEYREVLLVLVDVDAALSQIEELEIGEIDLEDLEKRIIAAASRGQPEHLKTAERELAEIAQLAPELISTTMPEPRASVLADEPRPVDFEEVDFDEVDLDEEEEDIAPESERPPFESGAPIMTGIGITPPLSYPWLQGYSAWLRTSDPSNVFARVAASLVEPLPASSSPPQGSREMSSLEEEVD